MATENILMAAVAAGGDRQDLHERIRRHSQAAAAVVKEQGGRNDLMDRLAADPAFAKVDLAAATEPMQFVGRAPQQVDEFSPKWLRRSGRNTPAKGRAKRRFACRGAFFMRNIFDQYEQPENRLTHALDLYAKQRSSASFTRF